MLDIQQPYRGVDCSFFRDGCALELLAGRVLVDVVLQKLCQVLLVGFLGWDQTSNHVLGSDT